MATQLDFFETGTYIVWPIDGPSELGMFEVRAEAEDYKGVLAEDWHEDDIGFLHIEQPIDVVRAIYNELSAVGLVYD